MVRRHAAVFVASLVTQALLVTAAATATAAPWGRLVDKAGKTIAELTDDTVVIGSGEKSAVRVDDRTVSERHIRLEHKSGRAWVEELGSRFGTLVAGTELKKGVKMQLFRRTELTLGAVAVFFEWGDRGKLIPPQREPDKAEKGSKGSKGGKGGKGGNGGKGAEGARGDKAKKAQPSRKGSAAAAEGETAKTKAAKAKAAATKAAKTKAAATKAAKTKAATTDAAD